MHAVSARAQRRRHPAQAALDGDVARRDELADPRRGLDLLEPELGIGVQVRSQRDQVLGIGGDRVVDRGGELLREWHAAQLTMAGVASMAGPPGAVAPVSVAIFNDRGEMASNSRLAA